MIFMCHSNYLGIVLFGVCVGEAGGLYYTLAFFFKYCRFSAHEERQDVEIFLGSSEHEDPKTLQIVFLFVWHH
jgi:hypothetical protein